MGDAQVRLSKAQKLMLSEIAETERGVLYVRSGSPAGRTAGALLARGLIHKAEPDYSSFSMHGWSLTDAGSKAAHAAHWPELTT